ncbi:MAG: Uma2 family endonuclease [Oscillatoriophycideae cyanobacterium NC_groundwater_1537_Pr4_S-0.65um_50_18]|nr:Uma2 family endonuclease [Oscillatoriophycideae cyanobacterium NC_groundwater_1537_Pr4_S-0.65um_50_18]
MTILREPLTIDLSTAQLSDEQFYRLCRQNEALRFEMTAEGQLVVMTPVGGESGRRESRLIARVDRWNEISDLGEVFSSSTIFRLPNGSKRSPDVAWVRRDRWIALLPEEREKFPPIAPDFALELRSNTDDLKTLQSKMTEYLANGVHLGWLINPQDQQVEIYRSGQPVQPIDLPTQLSGEAVLPGFVLDIDRF